MRSGKVDCERNDPPMYATMSSFAPDRTFSGSEGSTNVPTATNPSSRSITNCGTTIVAGNPFIVMQPRKGTINTNSTRVPNSYRITSSIVAPNSVAYHFRSENERPLKQLSRHLLQNFIHINAVTHLTTYLTKKIF